MAAAVYLLQEPGLEEKRGSDMANVQIDHAKVVRGSGGGACLCCGCGGGAKVGHLVAAESLAGREHEVPVSGARAAAPSRPCTRPRRVPSMAAAAGGGRGKT
jgi:hypothetical protein